MMIEFITDQAKYRITICQRLVQFEMLRLDKYPRGIKYKSTYTQILLCLNQRRPAPSRPPRGPCSCRGRCPPASPRPSPRPYCCYYYHCLSLSSLLLLLLLLLFII